VKLDIKGKFHSFPFRSGRRSASTGESELCFYFILQPFSMVHVHNEDRSPFAIHSCDIAPTPDHSQRVS
jgi:hypothetical protein